MNTATETRPAPFTVAQAVRVAEFASAWAEMETTAREGITGLCVRDFEGVQVGHFPNRAARWVVRGSCFADREAAFACFLLVVMN